MNGISLKADKATKELRLAFDPTVIDSAKDAKSLALFVKNSEYNHYLLVDENLSSAADNLALALAGKSADTFECVVGIAKDAELNIDVSIDKMQVELIITAPYAGSIPSVKGVIQFLTQHSITRGIGVKRIRTLLEQVSQALPGEESCLTVAKGLPPKKGRDSYVKPLVPNALERVLAPKSDTDAKVDMRDFGELLCVEPQQIVAKRMPPSIGRSGFTVTGEVLSPEPGELKPIKLGDNVFIPDDQENQVFAKVAGLPKYANGVISVDDVYMSKGVNVATGNIKYNGAVIVNGDVTENMKIIATGDVTINGFVESAYIESGGDIIITQGATGKMQDIDCQLIASGGIFLEHGQGLHMDAGKQINVIKQLAYSNVKCKENIIVGAVDNPQGKLFASVISCSKSIIAGHLGAVSGSSLSIDYSDAYNQLCDRFDKMNAMFKDLSTKNADHEIKVANINGRVRAGRLDAKMANLNKELELERVFLNWLRISKDELEESIDAFEVYARVIATKALYPGVNVKLNKTTWDTKKEYQHCRVGLEGGKWLYSPLI